MSSSSYDPEPSINEEAIMMLDVETVILPSVSARIR